MMANHRVWLQSVITLLLSVIVHFQGVNAHFQGVNAHSQVLMLPSCKLSSYEYNMIVLNGELFGIHWPTLLRTRQTRFPACPSKSETTHSGK